MRRAGLLSLLVLALLGGAGGCDAGEVVVFSPSPGGSGGDNLGGLGGAGAANFGGSPAGSGGAGIGGGGSGGDTVDKQCHTTNDCDPTWYCQKQNCSDAGGVCLPRPNTDDPIRLAVCGCDNLTYWNDTLRQKRGISASMPGECKFGVIGCVSDDACGTDSSANANMRCSRRLPAVNACSMPGSGQCWVVPSDCTGTSDKARFLPCPPPPGTPPPPCMTTCQAMNSGYPYLEPQNFNCP